MKVYVITRAEEHSDYVEKVFANKSDAEAYCQKYNINEEEYQRDMTEIEMEEPVSEDLEKESYHAAMRMVNNHDLILPSTTNAQLCTAYQNFYKEAANWQKQQMMQESVEGRVIEIDTGYYQLIVPALSTIIGNMEDYDKVKLIIVKEENQ